MISFEHVQCIGHINFNTHKFETIIVDRNLEWGSVHGVKTKIVDMDDSYLANLYDYLSHRVNPQHLKDVIEEFNNAEDDEWRKTLERITSFDIKLMLVIQEVQKERGLTKGFMDRAQIPYKNPNGKWEIWDFDKRRPIELEESDKEGVQNG